MDLASYLFARREALLHQWRAACEKDPSLHLASRLSQQEFNDHVPTILILFDQQLHGQFDTLDLEQVAGKHGLNRWHVGYSLRELLAEMNHLNQCLAAEVTAYQTLYPATDSLIMAQAYELVVRFGRLTVSGSVIQFSELQRKQAAERAEVLQQAFDKVMELTRQRGEFLRMTSHDLRGGFGVIQGAATLLNRPDTTEQQRHDRLQMLRRNLLTVSTMLSQLTDMARLEAGQETVTVQSVDASALLRSMVDSTQPLATERGLSLRADGPEPMMVRTDPVLVQRIVQNLLLNALQHTSAGLISVSWAHEDAYRWYISIQDTGTGLPAGLANALTEPLKPTLDTLSVFEKKPPASPDPAVVTDEMSTDKPTGEGIGLYVVKWLCQLLNASIDIETHPGQGTLFRVRLPIHGAEQ